MHIRLSRVRVLRVRAAGGQDPSGRSLVKLRSPYRYFINFDAYGTTVATEYVLHELLRSLDVPSIMSMKQMRAIYTA